MNAKKIELLQKAGAIFMRYGIKSVTMDEMASQLGISKKTLYQHFNDKNDLVNQVLQGKINLDKQACCYAENQSLNAIDEMIQTSHFLMDAFSNINPAVFFDLKKYHQDTWMMLEKHKKEFVYDIIKTNIERGKREELYLKDLDADLMARFYLIGIDSIMSDHIISLKEYRFDRLIKEIIQFQIRGMVNEKGLHYFNSLNKQNTNA